MTDTAAFDPVASGTDIQRRIGVKTSRDEPLARFTTMRVGGPADLFATAHNAFELRALVRFARSRGIPHLVLGRGSDVVIADAGVRGLVIQNRAEGSRVDGERYVAEATAFGLPLVVVPYPHAGGHQRANARELVDAGAARVIEDEAFDAAALLDVATLLEDAHAHLGMSAAARAGSISSRRNGYGR